ncbi:hypothetical protein CW749_10315 [Vibrio sp. vnigr-6D03]|uniref:hypothetical protein n=1 Tax=Vibrio sp. vnigr-6D03 TaxID=2058088 RepID=UPI000C33C50B|nr:hypothetical protein [Vibrio sp. vnigr-6D03]PKF80072.1 hypothetical protein CW749_10315 [Vibrio sp. vnigr-6D03]
MKLRKLVLACAIASPCVSAFEVCNIGDEYNVLDRESFHDIRKSNYRNFSEDLTPEDLFLSAPEHHADARPSLAEADEVFPETASLLEVGPVNVAVLESEEAASLLTTIGRSTAGFAKGALEALGPVGDTIAVGLWANEVAQAFEDETKTSYDRFATVMSLIDWFGVLKLPEREIDRKILTARWNRVAAGDHYSFTVHDDIITQQDKKDKQHWADLASSQQRMLEALAKGYASDVALKYQQHYQEALKAQAVLAETLINSVESEVQKAIFNKLALQGANAKLFASDLASTCRTEIDALLALYPDQEENNNRPMYVPSKQEANQALARLQHCQQDHLDLAVTVLGDLKNGEVEGLDRKSLHQLYRRTLNAKIKIVETANTQLDDLRTKLKAEMYAEGRNTIDRLFDSEAVAKAHRYFKEQADYLAIDEMSRSILGRPATATERRQKYFVIQEGYRKCTRIGILGGDPNFRGCTEYTWIPAKKEHYESSKDEVISQMVMPNRDAIKRVFSQSMDELINEGWNSQHEETWLEQQILSFSDKQRIIRNAETDKARVMRWLFDSSAALEAECGGGNACAAWSSSYLEKESLSRESSLHHIADWHERNKDSGYYVHSKRLANLEGFIRSALESEWQAAHVSGFYSYLYPGSFDLDKHAPLIASALKASNLNIRNLSASLPLAKGIVKNRILEAMSVADSNGEEWLASQIGDFQRYIAIVHAQNISTGHYASGEMGTTALLSEPLPAHLLRYLTLDVYHNIDDIDSAYYYPVNGGEEVSYDARLHASINDLFNTNSKLGKKLDLLVQVNESFTNLPGRSCEINYPQLRDALFKVSGDESLYWLTPFSDWFDSVTRQQLELFSAIRFGVNKQNTLDISCDLSPNNPRYW